MSEKTSLTDPPENLKEVIDWIVRISFLGYSDKLKNAVEHLEGFKDATRPLGTFSVEGLFNKVARTLNMFVGYGGNNQLDGQGIGQDSTVGKYTSSYKTATTWNNDWNASDSNSKTCAHILLCSMPLLYFGLTYIYWRCTKGGWQAEMVSGGHTSNLYWFLYAMGYDTNKLKNGKKASEVMTKVQSELNELQNASASSSYPEFLHNLQENGKPNLPQNAYNYSLYALYAASHAYLTTKLTSPKNKALPQTQSEIAATLKGYREAVKSWKVLTRSSCRKLTSPCLTKSKKRSTPILPPPHQPARLPAAFSAQQLLAGLPRPLRRTLAASPPLLKT
ncbi:variant erythrocyte surface antigen-1 family protein [Babesia caballi]|uniref:Variant erythrocyte surface antigen-1 family protein n=1 Tax=Babesia caballi TaxID=5871 RepID=A0AAV4LWY8_BABCB|nr:variant erythrocyte surface antigen-1 family protein [Babesia caballi]